MNAKQLTGLLAGVVIAIAALGLMVCWPSDGRIRAAAEETVTLARKSLTAELAVCDAERALGQQIGAGPAQLIGEKLKERKLALEQRKVDYATGLRKLIRLEKLGFKTGLYSAKIGEFHTFGQQFGRMVSRQTPERLSPETLAYEIATLDGITKSWQLDAVLTADLKIRPDAANPYLDSKWDPDPSTNPPP